MDDRDVELGEVVPGSAGPLSTSGLLSSNSSRPGTGFTEAERGELFFFVFFAVTAPPYLERKMNHCNQLVPAHTCIVSKRESLVWGGTGELSIKKSQKNSFIRVCICLCINPKKTYSSLFYIH